MKLPRSVPSCDMIVTSQTNTWVGNGPPACPVIIRVPANPVWTDTGIMVTNTNSIIQLQLLTNLSWSGGGAYWGPDGDVGNGTNDSNGFVTPAPSMSLIAFVGPSPFLDAGGTNLWFEGNTNFPKLSEQAGGTNHYWYVGSGGTFTNDRVGELWFGFNDDATNILTGDNVGIMVGELHVTPP